MLNALKVIIKSFILLFYHKRERNVQFEEPDKKTIIGKYFINNHKEKTSNRQRLSFVEKIKRNWQPRYYRVDLILNDTERRLTNIRREYTDFQNNREEFKLQVKVVNNQVYLSKNLFLCPEQKKYDSMIDLINNHRNSVICKNWKHLSPILLDLFYRLHKVLDRNNILAAKEIMEVIQYHLSLNGNKDEKEAEKIAKMRIKQLEQKREKEIIEKQKKKFKKQFN